MARINGSDFFRCRTALRMFYPKTSIILPLLSALRKSVPVKLDSFPKVRKKIFRAMPSGINVELVRDFLGNQLFMHLLCGGCKSVFVSLSTINVDRLSFELRLVFARQ